MTSARWSQPDPSQSFPESDEEPMPLSVSLDGVVKSLRGPSRRAVAGLFGRWAEAVGEQVAEHVRPVKLDAGVLSVEVDDPAWATQVKFLAPTIIARLAEVAGTQVDRIQVRVDPRSARGARI
jgi:predicted nucleic acid-binding Zn ribbon protein